MSVLIKGMKMPKDCIKCPFCLLADGYWKCLADGSFADFGGTCRPPKCPLIEVPTPHGRLIDADALKKHYEWWKGGTEEHTLDEMVEIFNTIVALQPTIIEAEEGEEE